MKHKITKKALDGMTPEKRRYWLMRIAKENGARRLKDWEIPFLSLGNWQVTIIRRIPVFLRSIYADTVEGRY